MKKLLGIIFIFALAFSITLSENVFAQEEEPTEDPVEEQMPPEEETTPPDEETGDGEEETGDGDSEEGGEEELTEEEIEEILEEAEEVTEEEIENLEDLEGEVIAVTDDEVVIETPSGEVITVATDTYERKLSGGSSSRRRVAVGQKIESGTVNKSGTTTTVKTRTGSYTVPRSIPVTTVAGASVSLDEVPENAEVAAVFDKDGNLVALELLSEELDNVYNKTLIATIVVIVVLILLALFARMKKKKKLQ